MRTTFACTACGGMIAAEVLPGRKVKCPLCQSIVTVPGGPALHSVAAPQPQPAPSSGFPPPMPQPVVGVFAPPQQAPQLQGAAIGSLVCGIIGMLGCAIPVGLIGLILGIVGTVRAARHPQRHRGLGLAISGIATGGLSLVIWPLIIIASIEPLSQKICYSQLESIHSSLVSYAYVFDGEFPEQEKGWQNRLVSMGMVAPYDFECPSDRITLGSSYFYVPGYNMGSPPDQIVVYEHPDIHKGGGHIVTVDGTVRFVERDEFLDLLDELTLPDGTPWSPHKSP